MHESHELGGAQAAAAIAVLVALGLTAPLLGVLMIPVAAIRTVARAVADGAGAAGAVHLID